MTKKFKAGDKVLVEAVITKVFHDGDLNVRPVGSYKDSITGIPRGITRVFSISSKFVQKAPFELAVGQVFKIPRLDPGYVKIILIEGDEIVYKGLNNEGSGLMQHGACHRSSVKAKTFTEENLVETEE